VTSPSEEDKAPVPTVQRIDQNGTALIHFSEEMFSGNVSYLNNGTVQINGED